MSSLNIGAQFHSNNFYVPTTYGKVILCHELKCYRGRINLVILNKGRLDKVHRGKYHGADMNRKIINIRQEKEIRLEMACVRQKLILACRTSLSVMC